MDKNAIKKYAVWARSELIERVSQRAMIYGITAKDAGDPNTESVNGHLLSQAEKRQRQALIRNIKAKGYEQVMEEVAYTWFNRFVALRFMEVNGYLPSHIRVFTNDAGEFKPQILAEAIHLELDGLDMNKVYELESANKSEELFKYLLIVQCNALNSILPGMFQRIEDYTELLLPDYLLREGSVIEQMVTTIPEEDWTDQVQIIGWLYQYYITEQNELVYDGNLSKAKVTKDLIPAATTIYTPDWPVHYMVENSLGRLWLEGHPNDALKSEWKYYLDETEQEQDVQAQLAEIRKQYAALKPEEIRVIDPCMGSGHILCVFFDVLVRIYEDYGYTAREAAAKIVENNLWGLDIDERATQLSYFAVMMKARQYDRRFFSRKVQPHVYAIEESNGITSAPMHDMGVHLTQEEYGEAAKQAMRLVEEMHDAKEYGSIVDVTPCDWDLLRRFAVPRDEDGQLHLDIHGEIEASARLQTLINIGEALSQKYHVIVTNPPYLGSNRFSAKLDVFVKERYPDVKSDLSMVMYKHALEKMSSKNGFTAFITTTSWMFLTSFEKLRRFIISDYDFVSLVDFGTELFEGKVGHNPIVSWVVRNSSIRSKMSSVRLVEYNYSRRDEKEPEFFKEHNRHYPNADDFLKLPSFPIAYWVSKDFIHMFEQGVLLGSIADSKQGIATADNNRFLRLWYECNYTDLFLNCSSHDESAASDARWYPYNKGGEFRKWYGNNDYVVNWLHDGNELRAFKKSVIRNPNFYFRECFSWSLVSSGVAGFRYKTKGNIFDVAGMSCFSKTDLYYLLGLCNSCVVTEILKVIAPTINYQCGDIANIPVIFDPTKRESIEALVVENIDISREDWDNFEVSWDFQVHPFIRLFRSNSNAMELSSMSLGKTVLLETCFDLWEKECEYRFRKLKENEESLNRMFIEIYGLGGELSGEVADRYVTVRIADKARDIKSFISYAVGCMFGRYSLDINGLAYAGGQWLDCDYHSLVPDADGIIPICDDEYFEDDIVGRFVKFVEVAFGKESLEENLRFIADSLGGKGSSREIIRSYFINDFYADHLKVYQKRPIYWLFDSGKKNGFKCLIYMHRYQPDTIARIRTDYVHEQQSRYRTAIADLEQRIKGSSTSERVKLSKQLDTLKGQAEEIRVYEEKIHHLADQMIKINLDDGVKNNYEIFGGVLAKVK